jgi:hypothetical protein
MENEPTPQERDNVVELGRVEAGVAAPVDGTAHRHSRDGGGASAEDFLSTVALLAAASLGVAVEAARLALRAADLAAELVLPVMRAMATRGPAGRIVERMSGVWGDAEWDALRRSRRVAEGTLPSLVDAMLDQLDFTEIVVRRLDVNAVVDQVDLDRLMTRIDLDGIVGRLDVDRIADRIDVNKIAERIDVDAILERVDLDDVVERLNPVALAQRVIEEIDLATIIRESTGTLTEETLDGIRVRSMDADTSLARLVSKLGLRRRDEDDGPGGSAPEGSSEVED